MVCICCDELDSIDFKLNVGKSNCIRICKQWHSTPTPIAAGNNYCIKWTTDLDYLGITVVAGSKFTSSLDWLKSKFYSSFNEKCVAPKFSFVQRAASGTRPLGSLRNESCPSKVATAPE